MKVFRSTSTAVFLATIPLTGALAAGPLADPTRVTATLGPSLVTRDPSTYQSAPLLGVGIQRSLAQRGADIHNIRDYGADGRGTAIGTSYGNSLATALAYASPNGRHPLAGLANPLWGLQVSMPLTTAIPAGGTSGNFTDVNTVIGGANGGLLRTFAYWNMPARGNMHIVPGMVVTAPTSGKGAKCLPTMGVTVSAVPDLSFAASARVPALTMDRNGHPVANSMASSTNTEYEPSGEVDLATASGPGCPAGTNLTFTVSPAQFQALTRDWIAFTAAEMDIVAGGSGGTVYVPAPGMRKNWPLALPMPNGGADIPQITVQGDPGWATTIVDTADLGALSCSMVEQDRSGAGAAHYRYTDLQFQGPGSRGVWGAPVGLMNGICVGSGSRLDYVNATGYHAGVWITQDHGVLRTVSSHDNFYGLWFGPEVTDLGNWKIEDSSFTGNAWAGVGVSAENTPNESIWVNDYCGLTPYCWYGELPSPRLNQNGNTLQGLLLAVKCDGCGFEQVGDGIVYEEPVAAGFNGLVFDNSPVFACTPDFQISGRGCPYYFYSAGFNARAWFVNGSDVAGNTRPGISYIAAGQYEGEIFFDQVDDLISATGSSAGNVGAVSGTNLGITFRTGAGGTGRFRTVEGGWAMNSGDIAGFGSSVSNDDSTKPLQPGHAAAGVLLQGGLNSAFVAVQDTGPVVVNLSANGSATITQYLCADPANPAAALDCPTPATAADIRLGIEVGPNQGTTNYSSGAQVTVHLRMN